MCNLISSPSPLGQHFTAVCDPLSTAALDRHPLPQPWRGPNRPLPVVRGVTLPAPTALAVSAGADTAGAGGVGC